MVNDPWIEIFRLRERAKERNAEVSRLRAQVARLEHRTKSLEQQIVYLRKHYNQ